MTNTCTLTKNEKDTKYTVNEKWGNKNKRTDVSDEGAKKITYINKTYFTLRKFSVWHATGGTEK